MAYRAWAAEHDAICPGTLDELAKHLPGDRAHLDDWGTPMSLVCEVTEEGTTVSVRWPGPDERLGTPDDSSLTDTRAAEKKTVSVSR